MLISERPMEANSRSRVATVGILSPLSISDSEEAATRALLPSAFWVRRLTRRELLTRMSAGKNNSLDLLEQ